MADRQERGLRAILEQPNRGRIFVVRTDYEIMGMANVLFTISTAMGGFVILLEDVIIHPEFRRLGYGTQLVQYVIDFAKRKDFLADHSFDGSDQCREPTVFPKTGFCSFAHGADAADSGSVNASTPAEKQRDLIEQYSVIEDATERFQVIVESAKNQADYPDEYRTDEYLVPGLCFTRLGCGLDRRRDRSF